MKKLQVCFVCFGNACRSQIAEGFARLHGSDVMDVFSAGLTPINSVPNQTRMVMIEKDAPIDAQYPKGVEVYRNIDFDLVINMSGEILPKGMKERERRWTIADPYGRSDGAFRQVRDELEKKVTELIEEIRKHEGRLPAVPPPRRRLFGF